MGQVSSQATRNSIISYVGVLLGYLNIAVLFPWMLTQELLGLMQVLLSAMLFTANLGSFGLQFIVVRYYPIFKREGIGTRAFFSFSSLIALGGILMSLLVLWIFQNEIVAFYTSRAQLFADYAYLLYFLVTFGILAIMIDSYSRAIMKSVLTAFYKEVGVRLLQLIAVLLFFFGITEMDAFLWSITGIQGLYILMMYMSVSRFSDIRFTTNWQGISSKLMRGVAKYGSVSMFSTSTFLANNSDVLLVGTFVGLKETAVYGVASAIGRVIGVPARAITRVATSVVADAWSKNDVPKIQEIYAKTAINNLIIGGVLLLGVVINTDLFLSIIPESYGDARPVILILAISKIVMMSTGINGPIIASSRHYWVNMLNNTASFLLLLISSYFFIQWMGMIGAAWGSLLVAVTGNLVKYLFLKVRYRMEFLSAAYIQVLALLIIGVLLGQLLPELINTWVDAITKSLIIIGSYILIIYRTNWSKDFSDLIDGALQRIGVKLK